MGLGEFERCVVGGTSSPGLQRDITCGMSRQDLGLGF